MKPYGYVRADGSGIFIYGTDKFEPSQDVELVPVYLAREWVELTDEFCITNMFDMGHYSLQIVFKSRKNADEFKAALQEKHT